MATTVDGGDQQRTFFNKTDFLQSLYFPRERPCKIPKINQYSYLSDKSSYSPLLHNREALRGQTCFFNIARFQKKKKKISQMYFSTVSLSNHQINSLTEQGQSFNETNGTAVYKIFSCIFSVWSCGCCSRLLNVKPT